jgi:hypothetical protein
LGFIGVVAKAILLSWIIYWLLAMLWFAATGQTVMAVLFLIGFLIPLSFIIHEYWQYRKKTT